MYNVDIFKFIYLSYILNRSLYNKRRTYEILYRERNDRVFFAGAEREKKMAEGRDGEMKMVVVSVRTIAVLASSPARLSK